MSRSKDIIHSLIVVVITVGLIRGCLYLEYQEAENDCLREFRTPECFEKKATMLREELLYKARLEEIKQK